MDWYFILISFLRKWWRTLCFIVMLHHTYNRFWQSLISLKGNRIPFFCQFVLFTLFILYIKKIVIYITFYVISFIKSISKMAENTTTLYACEILFVAFILYPRNLPQLEMKMSGENYFTSKIFIHKKFHEWKEGMFIYV